MAEKVYITLDALTSLEMKCKSCDAKIHYSLNQAKAKALQYMCPKCHEPWMTVGGDADEFIRNLAKWKLVNEKEGPNLGVELRLEISTGK